MSSYIANKWHLKCFSMLVYELNLKTLVEVKSRRWMQGDHQRRFLRNLAKSCNFRTRGNLTSCLLFRFSISWASFKKRTNRAYMWKHANQRPINWCIFIFSKMNVNGIHRLIQNLRMGALMKFTLASKRPSYNGEVGLLISFIKYSNDRQVHAPLTFLHSQSGGTWFEFRLEYWR
jgi:hypothetical protein